MSSTQKQSSLVHLSQQAGLTTLSNTDLVIAEQPDKKAVVKLLANSLERLSKLYQLQNWSVENAVYLAEWIADNYKYDSLDDVIECLANPPMTEQKQWRLTPDTIREWMAIKLEQTAIKREKEHNELKEKSKEALDSVDYEAFKERIKKEGLPKTKRGFQDEDYKRYRDNFIMNQNKPKEV